MTHRWPSTTTIKMSSSSDAVAPIDGDLREWPNKMVDLGETTVAMVSDATSKTTIAHTAIVKGT